jgi:uncharacterized protein YuzE
MRISYDYEIDAAYIRLADKPSVDQEEVAPQNAVRAKFAQKVLAEVR